MVAGDRRGGTELGFPTANVEVPDGICLPAAGIYAGWYERPDGSPWPAAVSVGRRPTFYGSDGPLLVEAFLLDFAGDLYGEEARVSFVARLRDEVAFDAVDALVAQMDRDVEPPGTRWPPRPDRAARPPVQPVGSVEELGPQLALQHLAGRIAGQRSRPEPEAGGHVESGQALAHEPGQLVGPHALAGAQHHHRPDLLARARGGARR